MNKLTLLICLLFSVYGFSQYRRSAVTDVPWTLSVGVNIIDNDGIRFDKPFATENLNFKNPFTISAERRFNDLLATNLSLSLNTLESSISQNGEYLSEDLTLFAIDATAKFYYDELFMSNYYLNWFQSYLISGIGYTDGYFNTTSLDFGLGFQFWIKEYIGIRIQSMAKWNKHDSYLQNNAEVIFRF